MTGLPNILIFFYPQNQQITTVDNFFSFFGGKKWENVSFYISFGGKYRIKVS